MTVPSSEIMGQRPQRRALPLLAPGLIEILFGTTSRKLTIADPGGAIWSRLSAIEADFRKVKWAVRPGVQRRRDMAGRDYLRAPRHGNQVHDRWYVSNETAGALTVRQAMDPLFSSVYVVVLSFIYIIYITQIAHAAAAGHLGIQLFALLVPVILRGWITYARRQDRSLFLRALGARVVAPAGRTDIDAN